MTTHPALDPAAPGNRRARPHRPTTPGDDELLAYLSLLAGDHPGGRLTEIRYSTPTGMAQRFIPAEHPDAALAVIARECAHTDVYTGVVLRDRRSGRRDAVTASHLAYVDLDIPDATQRLERFACPPSMTIATGTAGHLHAYRQLTTPLAVPELERLNRSVAHHLGGDPRSTDAARVLRPPSTLNHKHRPPTPVRTHARDPARRYTPTDLTTGLPAPPDERSVQSANERPRRTGRTLDDPLRGIPAAQYVRVLTGREPNRAGKIACPFHEDHTPSLQLYADGSWYCFGCARGGSIYDFAAVLWPTGTKGREFIALRDRLRAAVL